MAYAVKAGVALGVISLVACGGGGRSVEINPREAVVGTRWNASLATPANLVGVSQIRGTAWMAQRDSDSTRTQASVSVENAVPGGRHPWHIHAGQCGSNGGILGPPEAYPPLEVGGNGRAQSAAELPLPLPASGQYYVNVHASPDNMGTIVACGNLAPPIR